MRSLAGEGVFDGELSENDVKIGHGTLPGSKDFDPGTPGGSLQWLLMQELPEEYSGQAPDPKADGQLAFEGSMEADWVWKSSYIHPNGGRSFPRLQDGWRRPLGPNKDPRST